MRNSWEIIKEVQTSGTRPGSAGYQVALLRASGVFVALLLNLKDQKKAGAAFDADLEVSEALCNRSQLKELGLFRE